MIYLRRLKKLKKLSIGFNKTTGEIFVKILLNLKGVSVYQHEDEHRLIYDFGSIGKTMLNVRQATKVWIRSFPQRKIEIDDF